MSGEIELIALNKYKGTIATYQLYGFPGTTNGWVQVSSTQVLPSGTTFVQVRIRFPRLDGTVFVDDLSIR
jgi:hypothetical protein